MSKKLDALQAENAALRRKLENLQAKDIDAYTKARREIEVLARKCLTGSAVVITIRHLSGEIALSPIAISDGLGAATLECLANDIRVSHGTRIAMNPAIAFKIA
jgi:hypothetical protein